MENEWEWRMDSPPCEGGVAAPSIKLIRSLKGADGVVILD